MVPHLDLPVRGPIRRHKVSPGPASPIPALLDPTFVLLGGGRGRPGGGGRRMADERLRSSESFSGGRGPGGGAPRIKRGVWEEGSQDQAGLIFGATCTD